jgi:hypothetical protein
MIGHPVQAVQQPQCVCYSAQYREARTAVKRQGDAGSMGVTLPKWLLTQQASHMVATPQLTVHICVAPF